MGRVWLLALAALLLLWFVLDLIYVTSDNVTDYASHADVILVLGCPAYQGNAVGPTFSNCVRLRAQHAAELYQHGLAAHIIATGGLTGPPPSEAAAMASVLKAEGVPADAITLEEQARDTVQNVQYSRAVMQARGWRTAILVTQPHHIRRAALIARDAGLTVYPSPAGDNPGGRVGNLLRDAGALMMYQVRRLGSGPP
jgi:uncharacterized SAM-binding protein YcdF (DUF218 family)